MNKQTKVLIGIFAAIFVIFIVAFFTKTPKAPNQPGVPQVILEDGTIADPNEVVVTPLSPEEVKGEYDNLISQGTRKYVQEDYQGALKDYLQAQQIQPERFIAYYNAGNAYRNLNQISKAQEQFETALVYGPEEYAVYAALEEVYVVLQKDFDAARTMYQKAIARYPENARFYQAADSLEARIKMIQAQ